MGPAQMSQPCLHASIVPPARQDDDGLHQVWLIGPRGPGTDQAAANAKRHQDRCHPVLNIGSALAQRPPR